MADDTTTTEATEEQTSESSAPEETKTEPLGDAGKAALAKERERAKAAERELAKYKKAEADRAEADKSEAEKRTAAEAKVAELEAALLRRDVAHEKGLTPSQAKRLLGATREELEADADEILADFAARTPAKPAAPKPDPSQGAKGGPEPRSTSLGAAVTKALSKG